MSLEEFVRVGNGDHGFISIGHRHPHLPQLLQDGAFFGVASFLAVASVCPAAVLQEGISELERMA